jgi:hypothetical protein
MNKTGLFNRIWLSTNKKEYNRFLHGLAFVKEEQEAILFRYLKENANTIYGKKHAYAEIKSYEDFVKRVPLITDWIQLSEELELIQKGHQNVLTKDVVIALEETSGSSGFSKLIPYTKSLKKEFGKSLNVWMYSLWKTNPDAFDGPSFWSISPTLKAKRKTESGLQIGMESDLEYLDPLSALLMKQVLVGPFDLHQTKEKEEFYFKCIGHLLLAKNLSLVSVWSPNYFLVLDEFLRSHYEELLVWVQQHSESRYKELQHKKSTEFTWKEIWPNLSLLSCWKDAQAGLWIPAVLQKIGNVNIQGKGLMSTEAACSMPFAAAGKKILSYRSHFFEFKNIQDLSICRAHEVQIGETYEVIYSTASGLMRYCSGDLVLVEGMEQSSPYLSFKGRLGAFSDLLGEKLHECHVQAFLTTIWKDDLIHFRSVYFYAERMETYIQYTLAIETEKTIENEDEKVALSDGILCKNPYYEQAINSGQMKEMQVIKTRNGCGDSVREEIQKSKQIKDGDLKMPLLINDNNLINLIKSFT